MIAREYALEEVALCWSLARDLFGVQAGLTRLKLKEAANTTLVPP